MAKALQTITTSLALKRYLRKHSPTLFSINIEGPLEKPHEVGFALTSQIEPLKLEETYLSFSHKNGINCFNIPLNEIPESRRRKQAPLRLGKWLRTTHPEHEMATQVYERGSPDLVLVTFGGNTEMEWLSQNCPGLLNYMSACVDVQTLAAAATDNRHRGLYTCLKSLHRFSVTSRMNTSRPQRAGNNAVYILAVLATLLSRRPNSPPIDLSTRRCN